MAWWYDHRHDSGTDHDLVKLTIEKRTWSSTVRIADTVGENKQRAVDFDPAGWELELELQGNNVTSDAEGCGTDSTRVYYAYYWEDLDRDDSGKPLLDYLRDEQMEHPLVYTVIVSAPLCTTLACCPLPDDLCDYGGRRGFDDAYSDAEACAEYGTSMTLPVEVPDHWAGGEELDTCYESYYDSTYWLFWEEYCA